FGGGGNGGAPAKTGQSLGGLDLWDVETGKVTRSLYESRSPTSVHSLAVSPDGKIVAAANYRGPTQVWEVSSGKELGSYCVKGMEGAPDVAFSSDSKLLVIFDLEIVTLWEMATGKEAIKFTLPHAGGVTSVWCLPDGRVLALADTIHERSEFFRYTKVLQ